MTLPRRDDDGEQLQRGHHVDDAVAGAEFAVRLAEPVREHAIFGHAHQHAGRADDRGVDRAGEDQKADHHHKDAEDDAQRQRPDHVHGHAGDQVVAVDRAPATESGISMTASRDASAGEDEAVDGDHDRGALQVLELGMLDLAVDLGQRFLAAHRQHRVAEGHQHAEQARSIGANLVPFRKPSASSLKMQVRGRWAAAAACASDEARRRCPSPAASPP